MAEVHLGNDAGIADYFAVNDSLCKVLARLQSEPSIFGLVDLVASPELVLTKDKTTENPIWLIMQDCGLKLRFDPRI
jgi:hypothetical protein